MRSKPVLAMVIIDTILMGDHVLGQVILCSRHLSPWPEAMKKCLANNGLPLRAPRHTEGPLPSFELKNGIQGWTGDYTLNNNQERCGYLHINDYLVPSEVDQFADCDQGKHYICCHPNKDGPCTVQNYHVYSGPWYEATKCAVNVTIEDLSIIQAPPGDYWTMEGPNWSSIDGPNLPMDQMHSCGTISGSLDHYRQPDFEYCKSSFIVLCIFDTHPLYTFEFASTCFKGNPVVQVSTSSLTAASSTTIATKSTMHSTVGVVMNDTVQPVSDTVTPSNTTTVDTSTDLFAINQLQTTLQNDGKQYNEVTIALATGFGVILIGCVLSLGIFVYRRKAAAREQDAFSVQYKNGVGSSNVCINNATRGHTNAAYVTGSIHTEDLYDELTGDNDHNVYVRDPNTSNFQGQDKVAHKPCFHHLSAVEDIQVYALPKKINGNRVDNKSVNSDNEYLEPNQSNHNIAINVVQRFDSDEESFVDDFSSDESDFDGPAHYTNEKSKENDPTSTSDGSDPDCYYNATGLYQDIGEQGCDVEPVEEQALPVITDSGQFEITLQEDSDGDIYEEYSCA